MEFTVAGQLDGLLKIGFVYMCGRIDCDRAAEFFRITGTVSAATATAATIAIMKRLFLLDIVQKAGRCLFVA